jgi:ribosomal protein S18 acetylase RimI-like enzyme
MSYLIRAAVPADLDAMLRLFPRLAAFRLPPRRTPEDLWHDDAALLRGWAAGRAPTLLVYVAEANQGTILGVAMVSLRDELLSHAPSAHLEVLVVDAAAEGRGIGRALVHSAEQAARAQGAQSMTLHVFANNTRARAVYEALGYDGELLRYIKHFE